MRKIKQSLALLNALCLLGSSATANPITIDADHTGPSPTLGKTDNGVDLINIAKPNQAGISSNFYKDFNVEKEGLILNNISQKEDLAKTVLAGYIAANPNLETAAKLILNQVSGNKLSNLLGFLEVAGKQADVILANPNGITCHGCGFINIENLTLATGKFSQDEFHRLNQLKAYEELKTLSLDITQGKIITSALNASNTKTLTFLAKNMEVNGIVEGGDKIRALLGSNHVNFSPSVLLYEPIKLEGEQQALGLDVTYLGGVFAKSIYLVATNEGIGVKNSGILASTASQNSGDGGFVIDANGTIEITKPQTALIKQIQATKDLQNEGEKAPAPSALPLIFSNQNLNISAKTLVNHSILYAKDNLNIKAENILNQGALEFIQDPATREKFYSRDPNINGYFGGSKTYYMTYDYTIKTIKESIQKDTYSPAMMLANNIHLQSQTTTNDNALIQANNDFQNASKEFINKAPQAKSTTSYEGTKTLYNRYGKCFAGVKIGFNCASTRTTSAFVRADKVEFTDVELPEITLQDTSILLQDTLQNTKSSTPLPTPYVQNKDVLDLLVARRMQDTPSTRRDIMDFSIFQGSYQKNLLLGLQAHSIVISSQNTYNSSAITGNDITITSQALLNENGTLLARDSLKLKGEAITNQGGKILAQNISIDADGFTHTSSITSHKKDNVLYKSAMIPIKNTSLKVSIIKKQANSVRSTSENTKLVSLGILEGNHIIIKSKETHLIGANVDAKGDLLIQSDALSVKTLALKDDYADAVNTRNHTNQQVSSIQSGSDIVINSKQTNLISANIDAKGDLLIQSDALNVKTLALKDNYADAVNTRNHTNQQVTSIQSGNHLLIDAKKQEYASVKMKGDTIALTGENILFDTSVNKSENKKLTRGILSPKLSTAPTTQHIANEIQGINLAIHSKSDFTAYNFDADITDSLSLKSDANLLISNHADSIQSPRNNTNKYSTQIDKSIAQTAKSIKLESKNIALIGANVDAKGDLLIQSDTLNVKTLALKDDYSDGTNIRNHTNQQVTSIQSGNHLLIDANKQEYASVKMKGENIALQGENIRFDTSTLFDASTKESFSKGKKFDIKSFFLRPLVLETTTQHIANEIQGTNLAIHSKSDFTAYNLQTDSQNLAIQSDKNILISNHADSIQSTQDNINKHSTQIDKSIAQTAKNIKLESKNIALIGANVDAKGDLLIQSDTLNVKTLALKDDYSDGTNIRNHTNQQVTSIQSGNHLLIDANKQEYTSVKMKGENIALQGENILFDTSTKESFSKTREKKTSGWFLDGKTTITTTTASTSQHIANEIQGSNLAIHSKNDFTAYNLQTDSQNLAIQSDKNILISNHADTKNVVVDTEIKKRSLYGSISKDKISAGLRTSNTKIHQDTNDKNHHNTTLKANHASFVAQGNTAIQSTNIQSDDLALQGESIALKALQDEHTSLETKHVTSHTFGVTINRRPLERLVIKYANSLGSKLGIKESIKVPEKEDIKAGFSYQYSDDFTKTQSYATSTSNLAIQSKNLQMDSKNDTVITNADITTDVFAAKNKNLAINTLENVKTTTTTKYNDTINASLKLSLGKQTGIKAHADYAHDGSKEKNRETSHVANHFKIGTLNLDTKNDVKIQGSHLDIKEDANITAKNFAITSVSNTETNEKTDKKHNAALDFTYNGGFNVALSGGYGDSSSKENKVTQVASSLSAKNLNLKTSEKTQILGSRLNIEEDANITAKSFIITSTENSFAKTTHSKDANASLSAGFDGSLDLGANGGYTQKVTTQSNNSALSSDVSIKNLNLQSEDTKIIGSNLATKKAQITSKNLWIGSIQTYSKDTESSLGAQAGLGNKSGVKTAWDYNNKAQNSTGQTASHVSLGDFQIEVRGDTQIKGSHLSGDNGSIQTQNLNVLSSEETQKSHNIGLGAGNTNLKFRGNASLDLHTQTTQSASSIEAQNLKLAVKNDMNVESSQIKSENLDAKIGKNLNMVSKKDTEASFGVSGSLDMATKKKDFGIKGSIASQVKQQSSIEASNANIKVGNQTKLVGAKIEAKKGSFDSKKVSKESLIDYKVSLDKKSGKKLQKDFGHGITKSHISIN
ncbi:haemagglutinin [Helicobacter mustelae]|uniref:hemagglutinin repeat-containing protein n=1 Tax=Helicobacter mustelae TaxID=217 RepID=UPI000E02E1FC|nr:hemagglutinin repeat-containing protein [Helicobacter mustelae]STP14161.1 haemagglutinin [Helicobacter mustelae]